MQSCDCPHSTEEHATAQDVGSAMCMVRDCDCDGTREQVAAMAKKYWFNGQRLSPTMERLVDIVREVLSNPMHVTAEEKARNVSAAIVATFEMVER
jgi:hypothetical protein